MCDVWEDWPFLCPCLLNAKIKEGTQEGVVIIIGLEGVKKYIMQNWNDKGLLGKSELWGKWEEEMNSSPCVSVFEQFHRCYHQEEDLCVSY